MSDEFKCVTLCAICGKAEDQHFHVMQNGTIVYSNGYVVERDTGTLELFPEIYREADDAKKD